MATLALLCYVNQDKSTSNNMQEWEPFLVFTISPGLPLAETEPIQSRAFQSPDLPLAETEPHKE